MIAIIALACGSSNDNDDAQTLASTQSPPPAPSQAPPPDPTATPATAVAVEEEPLSAEEGNYLNKVTAADGLPLINFSNFRTIFRQAWPVRSQLITTLLEAGLGETFIPTQNVVIFSLDN